VSISSTALADVYLQDAKGTYMCSLKFLVEIRMQVHLNNCSWWVENGRRKADCCVNNPANLKISPEKKYS
jgi:hypothetical protein